MITGLHFLLTYRCPFECDHCFLFCGPSQGETFTLAKIKTVLAEARRLGGVTEIFFEGGEPFMYYPLLLEGLRQARELGFETGVVTNCYWAVSEKDALVWLKPLREAGLEWLTLSDDAFHFGDLEKTPADRARAAAEQVGLKADVICIDPPVLETASAGLGGKGEPVVGGGAKFRGRAAEKLVQGLPLKTPDRLTECPFERLDDPGRVHIDPLGRVMVCQGLGIGNFLEKPLSEILAEYDPKAHPICGPLLRGGPVELAREYGLVLDDGYVDECHLCFASRKMLMKEFPGLLGPPFVYGLEG